MAVARYRLREAALICWTALGLHEARYLIAYGDHSGEELAQQGHAYLPFASALAVGLLALAGAQLLATVARARRTGAHGGSRRAAWKLWLVASAALLVVHAGQELAEGLVSSGHPHGAAALLANGGWVCLPLALGFGGLVTLGLRGAELAVRAAAGDAAISRPLRPLLAGAAKRSVCFFRGCSPLASKLAGRAPPQPS